VLEFGWNQFFMGTAGIAVKHVEAVESLWNLRFYSLPKKSGSRVSNPESRRRLGSGTRVFSLFFTWKLNHLTLFAILIFLSTNQ
jgi:hypothetical protein